MIKVFDQLTSLSSDLYYSLNAAGFEGDTVVLSDDSALPDGLESAYTFFCQMAHTSGKPLYFNQVVVPEYWQITGNNVQGEIWNLSIKKANIYYHEPKHLRLVRQVEWLDDKQAVYKRDYYNQYGWMYAQAYINNNNQETLKKYYNQNGQEVIINHVSKGVIFVYWEGKTYHFEKRIDFLRFYFQVSSKDMSSMWFNTLSTPFLMSYYASADGDDVLFWQETIGEDIPGNMQLIFSGAAKRVKKIVVQNKDSYNKLQRLLTPDQQKKIAYLGYIYPNRRENQNKKDILILTNSDQIEQLEKLVPNMSTYHFHIGALTEMSPKLTAFGEYQNVTLYPNISSGQVEKLFQICDIYLDINHGSEIVNSIRQAFEHNLVIVGFNNTLHNPEYVAPHAVFSPENPLALIDWLDTQSDLRLCVAVQRQHAGEETVERYREVLSSPL